MTENVDAEIDTAQSAKYASATRSGPGAAILSQDSAWLAARGPVCDAAFSSGGTIDGISARPAARREQRQVRLRGGDHPARVPAQGHRQHGPERAGLVHHARRVSLAELSTQGDQTGGAVVSWIVIGGANGFVMNPKQFFPWTTRSPTRVWSRGRTPRSTGWRRERSTSSHRLLQAGQGPGTGTRAATLRARCPGGGVELTRCRRCPAARRSRRALRIGQRDDRLHRVDAVGRGKQCWRRPRPGRARRANSPKLSVTPRRGSALLIRAVPIGGRRTAAGPAGGPAGPAAVPAHRGCGPPGRPRTGAAPAGRPP